MKPWLSEQWCIGKITGAYLYHMEDVLNQYEMPCDPFHPLICFDERPCFLIEDIGGIIPMSPGKAKRYHHEYGKNGSCCVFIAFEPHTPGFRCVEVRARRTAVDHAEYMQNVSALYKHAVAMKLVQDNLNTHTPGSFYKVLPPGQAFAMSERFELHYTPEKGSWLNMAEIELAALSTQCPDRRIPDMDRLREEVPAWAENRNEQQRTVNRTFARHDAGEKLERHYNNVRKLL